MSIHIGNFRCQKCQQGFASEEKLTEHATSCNGKSEFEDHTVADEDNAKNDNDEKGSLIADETSVIEEAEEAEEADFESEGEGSRDIQDEDNSENSEEDNSENSDDSDSDSNSSSSEEENENEEGEEEEEEEEENENENESDTRTTSRASGDSVSCNSDSDNESDIDETEVNATEKKVLQLNDINRFRIHGDDIQGDIPMENVNDQKTDLTSVTVANMVAEQTKPSNLNDLLSSNAPENMGSVKFEAFHFEESAKATISDADSDDNEDDNEEDDEENNENEEEEDVEEGDEIEGEDENEGEAETEAESGNEDEAAALLLYSIKKEEEEEEEDEDDEDDDDGPPVLSPIMPLLPENESEEHSGMIDRTRHKLSPMVSLSMAKDLEDCEITEIPNDAGNVSNTANFFTANNNDLSCNMGSVTWDENLDDNGIDNGDCNSDAADREKNEELSKEYKIEVNEGDDFEEDFADENVVDSREGGDGDNQVHEVHNLDGTVLMVANDAEGNQILIEQNVLDIDNEDSNAEVAQYIYPENAYEIEKEDYATRNETDVMQTDEMQVNMSYVQDTSENEDSNEGDIEENISDVQKQ